MAIRHLPARPLKGDSGQILVLTAVIMVVLLGIAALSLDASYMYDKRNRLQAAADAAAKSAAIEVFRNPGVFQAHLEAFADQQVAAHGFSPSRLSGGGSGGGATSVVVTRGPLSGPSPNNPAYVEVIVSENTATFFARVLGRTTMTPGAVAVAGASTSSACLITFDDFRMDNVNTVTMPSCTLSVGGDMDLGNGTTINSASAGVTGNCLIGPGGSAAPCGPTDVTNLHTGAPPPSDPLFALPPPAAPAHSCSSPTTIDTAVTISESNGNSYFCGLTFDGPNGVLTLTSGVYYIDGPITAKNSGSNVTITGSDVMIYLGPNGSIDLDANQVVMNLSGRTVAPYKSILFYQDRLNDTPAYFAKNNGSFTLTGTLYFPIAPLSVKNNLGGGFGGDCFLAISMDLELKNNGLIQNTCSAFGGSPFLTVTIAQ